MEQSGIKKLKAYKLSQENIDFITEAGSELAPQFIKMQKKGYYNDTEYLEAILAFARRTLKESKLAEIHADREKKVA